MTSVDRMAYIEGRLVHDADSHIMETAQWLYDYADPDIRELIAPSADASELHLLGSSSDEDAPMDRAIEKAAARHASADYRAEDATEIMNRKNFDATGSFLKEDRPQAIDMIGVASQLVFNTFQNARLHRWEHEGNLDLAYGAARAHNRGMLDFCDVDVRMLPTCYVPLADFDRASAMARECIDQGAAALLVASGCPADHSPSHRSLDPVWAQAQEAGIPIVFHVGGTGEIIDPAYFNNGLPIPPDFHGGDENFRSVDYMGIPRAPQQTLATMIFDGVLERFTDLKIGVVELGAIWLPSWMKQMESAFDAFSRHEERLQALSMRPSDYVVRQIRSTPYPTEDVGWIIDNIGPEICMFSTDYPHVEGGRRPVERFERSLGDRSEAIRHQFYAANFEDLMGAGLPVALAAA